MYEIKLLDNIQILFSPCTQVVSEVNDFLFYVDEIEPKYIHRYSIPDCVGNKYNYYEVDWMQKLPWHII